MGSQIEVVQTSTFSRALKRLRKNQKADLDEAIKVLLNSPLVGEKKRGDLAYLRVYKFNMSRQPTLLGYSYEPGDPVLQLIALGPHENFDRDAKR